MGKKLVLSIAAVFLACMVCVTVYAQRRHEANLPVVELGAFPSGSAIPESAILHDGFSSFVWEVKEADGPWGKEYVVSKKYISLLSVEQGQAQILDELRRPIVTRSETPLQDGQGVRF